MTHSHLSPFVVCTRGSLEESLHFGSAAIVSPSGALLAHAGDPEHPSFFRSSSKPLQVIPMIESGAADRFGLTLDEIAVACGSHGGEDIHVAAVSSILSKIGLSADHLACGTHPPYDKGAAAALAASGTTPSAIHNNCSGKHAGMLALCMHRGWDPVGYERFEHPVQQAMLCVVSDFTGVQASDVHRGVDGCSVATFGVSTRSMALSFARLAAPPAQWRPERRAACRRVVEAMIAHPEMVAARQHRIDTELMRAFGGRLIAKAGAEGVYCMATIGANARGIALKLLDGDEGGRARSAAVMGLLAQDGLLDDGLRELLAHYGDKPLTNRVGIAVGAVQSRVALTRPSS